MKLIIDITKVHYELIKWLDENGMTDNLQKKVVNGTPLPKGHGNLIDYYDAVELINNKADEENSNFTINDIEKFGALLREVNPIIEADKAESEVGDEAVS